LVVEAEGGSNLELHTEKVEKEEQSNCLSILGVGEISDAAKESALGGDKKTTTRGIRQNRCGGSGGDKMIWWAQALVRIWETNKDLEKNHPETKKAVDRGKTHANHAHPYRKSLHTEKRETTYQKTQKKTVRKVTRKSLGFKKEP